MKRINGKKTCTPLLCHDIKNELIALMSKTVTDEVSCRIKEAKYYSVLLYCTRDYSRVQQMLVVLKSL